MASCLGLEVSTGVCFQSQQAYKVASCVCTGSLQLHVYLKINPSKFRVKLHGKQPTTKKLPITFAHQFFVNPEFVRPLGKSCMSFALHNKPLQPEYMRHSLKDCFSMNSDVSYIIYLQVGTPRAKDNAQKAMEMLATERVRETGTPRAIPPTSPVEHNFWKRKGMKKARKTDIMVATGGTMPPTPTSVSDHDFSDINEHPQP